ncbi:MAG: response regulator [Fibrobacteria bacterium]|nr:response regulator [Fibrobacteria bacterium]
MSQEYPLKGCSILLVEDDPGVLELVNLILTEAGATVVAVGDPDAASSLVPFPKIDILVTDVVLPGRSGFQLAEEIVGMRPSTKVLFMSGYGDPEIGARDLPTAFDSALKPFLPEDLVAKLFALRKR